MHDELDSILDEALAGYSKAAPLNGLESRILARVHTAHAQRRRVWWLGVTGVAAALVVSLAIRIPQPAATLALTVPPAPVVVNVSYAAPQRHITIRPAQLTPRLSNEERSLIALTQRYPELAQQAFEDLRRQTADPLEIAPIVITPLDGAQ